MNTAPVEDDAGAPSASMVVLDVLTAMRLEPADIAERQSHRLRGLLDATARDSAFYRRRWRGIDLASARLQDLPVVHKRELMAQFPQWVTDKAITRAALHHFMADARRCGRPFLGRYAVWESSGSSGEPAVFVQDSGALAVYDALEALRRHSPRPWQRLLDPLMLGERFAFVGAIDGHFASHVSLQRQRRLRPWLAAGWRSFSILQPVADLVAQLNAFAPTLVATYPTAAALLADEAERGALHIAPQELWTGGETLSPAVRRRVQEVLRCHVRNSYGASEFLPLAWECGEGRLHLNEDWAILEAVDAEYHPVPPGTPSHTSLLTNLANRVQPLVRYELGDQICIAPERCACGSPLPVIDVCGRRDDALQLRGADGRAVTLLPLALTTVLEDRAGVYDFQLCQIDERTLQLRLGPAAAAAGETCRRVLLDFARVQGLGALRVQLRAAAELPHGRSGKLMRVVACHATPSRPPASAANPP
jgi:phenylacetate-coenzyme A ligase PaaK-like adenylate-forming protein